MVKPVTAWILVALLNVTVIPAWAQQPSPPSQLQMLESDAQLMEDEAFRITRADHNPRKADYYRASSLYSEAATRYEQARMMLLATPNADETALTEAKSLERKVTKLRFQAHQTYAVARRRDWRNMY